MLPEIPPPAPARTLTAQTDKAWAPQCDTHRSWNSIPPSLRPASAGSAINGGLAVVVGNCVGYGEDEPGQIKDQ
jgi:hypothetical protein